MPKVNYKLSKEAQNDLEQIWLYTLENCSIDQADRYLNLLIDEMEYLCLKPNSGFNFDLIRTGYWRAKVKSRTNGCRKSVVKPIISQSFISHL